MAEFLYEATGQEKGEEIGMESLVIAWFVLMGITGLTSQDYRTEKYSTPEEIAEMKARPPRELAPGLVCWLEPEDEECKRRNDYE